MGFVVGIFQNPTSTWMMRGGAGLPAGSNRCLQCSAVLLYDLLGEGHGKLVMSLLNASVGTDETWNS